MNKSPISSRANRLIGASPPSVYVAKLCREAGITSARMDAILRSHLIDPAALLADDFDAFFTARQEDLLQLIEAATGKPAARNVQPSEQTGDVIEDEFEQEAAE